MNRGVIVSDGLRKEDDFLKLDRDRLVHRFMDYISYNTQSDEENDQVYPSTPGQMVLAKHLKEELEGLGLSEVTEVVS